MKISYIIMILLFVLLLLFVNSANAGTVEYRGQLNTFTAIRFYDHSAGTYTERTASGTSIQYFETDAVTGDALMFQSNSYSGKYGNITFDVLTAVVPDGAYTYQWEYCVRGSSTTDDDWLPLHGVVDETNGFQNVGKGNVTFEIPEDWENFINPSNVCTWYCWNIKINITSSTGFSGGGGAQDAVSIKKVEEGFYCSGFSSAAPCTMNDIYNQAVIDGVDGTVITRSGSYYNVNCTIRTSSTSGDFVTKNETIEFNKGWDSFFSDKVQIGQISTGSKCMYGSTLIYHMNDSNLNGYICGADSEIYGANIIHIVDPEANSWNGHWGGTLGDKTGQTIYQTFISDIRHCQFSLDENAIIGIDIFSAHVEPPGAIIQDVTCYDTAQCFRPKNNNDDDFVHQCDMSGTVSNCINPWQVHSVAPHWKMDFVDCNWGTVAKANRAYWQYSSSVAYYQPRLYETYSMELRLIDELNNNLSGATVTLDDNDGNQIFSYTTNENGFVGVDNGTITQRTSSTMMDSSKSWSTNQWWFHEVLITSGSCKGARRIIHKGNNGTEITVAPNWATVPPLGSNYVIIPYIRCANMTPKTTKSTCTSNYTYLGPFTMNITKTNYESYTSVFDMTEAYKGIIVLENRTWDYDVDPIWQVLNTTDTTVLKLKDSGDLAIAGDLYENTNSPPPGATIVFQMNDRMWLEDSGDLYVRGFQYDKMTLINGIATIVGVCSVVYLRLKRRKEEV